MPSHLPQLLRLSDIKIGVVHAHDHGQSSGRPYDLLASLVEVGHHSKYGTSQVQHKVAPLTAEYHEKLAAEYKQRMVRKEAQVESLLSRLADVKNDLISQAMLIKDNLKAEQLDHGKTREELLESRTEGERLLVAYNSIQAEYLSLSASLKATKHDLDMKTQEAVALQEGLDGALETVTQLRDSINALGAEKADLQFAISLSAVNLDSLRTRLSELEVTREQTSLDLQATKEERSQERLESEARVSGITASLVVAQAALESKKVEVDYLTTAKLLAETAYNIESSQRLENTKIFDAERARLRNSLSDARAKILELEITSQDAEKMNKALEQKVQELLELHSGKEQKLSDALVIAGAELASERLAKEAAIAENTRLKAVLATRDGAYRELRVNKEYAETRSKAFPIADIQSTSFSEGINDTLLATSLSDKENCEATSDILSKAVVAASPPPLGFNTGNIFDPRYCGSSGSSATQNLDDTWGLDDVFSSVTIPNPDTVTPSRPPFVASDIFYRSEMQQKLFFHEVYNPAKPIRVTLVGGFEDPVGLGNIFPRYSEN